MVLNKFYVQKERIGVTMARSVTNVCRTLFDACVMIVVAAGRVKPFKTDAEFLNALANEYTGTVLKEKRELPWLTPGVAAKRIEEWKIDVSDAFSHSSKPKSKGKLARIGELCDSAALLKEMPAEFHTLVNAILAIVEEKPAEKPVVKTEVKTEETPVETAKAA